MDDTCAGNMPGGSRRRAVTVLALSAAVLLAAVAPLLAGIFSTKQVGSNSHSSKSAAQRRADWFFRPRAFPAGYIPAGARQKAYLQMREMLERTYGAGRSTSGTAWQSIGPAPTAEAAFGSTSGRVTSLVVDPSDTTNKTVYLGAADGGVWKTTDATNWSPLTDPQPSLAIGSLALDKSTVPPTIYAGTGEENFSADSYYGAGVLKSIDGGQTWTASGVGAFGGATSPMSATADGPYIGAMSVSPNTITHAIVLAGVKGAGSGLPSGIWRSSDGATSWIQVLPSANNVEGTDVAFDPNDSTGMTAYAALGHPDGDAGAGSPCAPATPCNGVYVSSNAGASWTRLTGLDQVTNQTTDGRITLALGPQVSGKTVVYAAIADATSSSADFIGIFKSLDGGVTWAQMTEPPNSFCEPECYYDMALRVSPVDSTVVFAGGASGNGTGSTLYRSIDGANSWQDVTVDQAKNAIHVAQHSIAFSSDGTQLYVGNDGGVWGSSDVTNKSVAAGAQTWNNLNSGSTTSGLSITQFSPGVSIHPASDNVAFGGTQGNAAQLYLGGAWQYTGGEECDGGYTAFDATEPSTIFVTCEDLQQPASVWPFIFRSMTGGLMNDFAPAENGIDTSDSASYLPPLIGDPSKSGAFYLATDRVYRSLDSGSTWAPVSADLTGNPGDYLTAMAVAPNDSNTLYVGAINGIVQVSKNVLSSSVGFAPITAGLPLRSVTALAVDLGDSQTAYVAFSGFSGFDGDAVGHVFQTVNGGAQWNDISGNLPNIPVNAIVVDPDIADTLYVGTDVGVFTTSNSGVSWSPLGTGLPNVVVLSLGLRSASRVLSAGTHGRGVWDLALGGLPAFQLTDLSPVAATAGAPSFPLTVTGSGFTSSSKILLNSTPLTPTTLNADGSLSATVPASSIQAGGVYNVSVMNGSTSSNFLQLAVSNPVPTISALSPTAETVGTTTFTLSVTGTNFVSNSVVNFGNSTLTPATGSTTSTTITVTVPQSSIATASVINVTVTNPAPGGGTSNPEPFDVEDYTYGTVTPAVVTVNSGAIAQFQIPVIALNGLSATLTLACGTGLPGDATCTFNPSTIVPTAAGAVEMLQIQTQHNNSLVPIVNPRQQAPPPLRKYWFVFAAAMLLWFFFWARWLRQAGAHWRRRLALGMSLAGLVFMAALAGCGGGSGQGTPDGTYLVTISATGTTTNLDTSVAVHDTTVTVVVQN
ncbi:MAG: sialidase family protein [Candidatus Acidiferrales bacterium]